MEFTTPKVLDSPHSFNDDESDGEFSTLSSSNKENINKETNYSLTGKSPKTQFKGNYYLCVFN